MIILKLSGRLNCWVKCLHFNLLIWMNITCFKQTTDTESCGRRHEGSKALLLIPELSSHMSARSTSQFLQPATPLGQVSLLLPINTWVCAAKAWHGPSIMESEAESKCRKPYLWLLVQLVVQEVKALEGDDQLIATAVIHQRIIWNSSQSISYCIYECISRKERPPHPLPPNTYTQAYVYI